MVEAENLTKTFNGFKAVDAVSFEVEGGEIFGFLGPNGAGKTTTINMLCTLYRPSSGLAYVNGYDVSKEPHKVRRSIGLVFQDPSLDDKLTAEENLDFHGILYGLKREERARMIDKVLEMVELSDRKHSLVSSFSGGMKRRLEIARGLMHSPKVLFLDEPTLGLDPQTRSRVWDYIHRLRSEEGVTVFMTTHYMDEAENCDRVAIMDHGRIIALDEPSTLKTQIGGDVITLKVVDVQKAELELKRRFNLNPRMVEGQLTIEVAEAEEFIPNLVKGLDMEILSLSLRKPTLNDVFLKLTGREIREEAGSPLERMRMIVRARGR
jgi:ABC-2 type transport system ATP-binding protein